MRKNNCKRNIHDSESGNTYDGILKKTKVKVLSIFYFILAGAVKSIKLNKTQIIGFYL